jgi:hypothetical protein
MQTQKSLRLLGNFSAFLAVLLLATAIAYAVTLKLPDIPTPKFSIAEAIKMTEGFMREKGKPEPMLLVAVDWSTTESFQPRFSRGESYHWLEPKTEWSWFLTYVGRGPSPEVHVFRLRSSGQIVRPGTTRT